MIDLYYWPTPNGWKVSVMLEECGLEYRMLPVNIGQGEQFKPEFLAISPNNRMPAIVDHAVDGAPLAIFESGAILQYLAEKTGRFIPEDLRARYQVLQWLYWQMAGLGPMLGQVSHFTHYAPQVSDSDHSYALKRYINEGQRLMKVMDTQLTKQDFLAGVYSIADMAAWAWIVPLERFGYTLDEYPHLLRWRDAISARPAVARGFALGKDLHNPESKLSETAKRHLFGQTGTNDLQ